MGESSYRINCRFQYILLTTLLRIVGNNVVKLRSLNFMMTLVDTVQDFLIMLGIKPRLRIFTISIFSLNHVIIRPTKIMNNLLKVCKFVLSKSFFSIKFNRIVLIFFCEEYLTRRSTLNNDF